MKQPQLFIIPNYPSDRKCGNIVIKMRGFNRMHIRDCSVTKGRITQEPTSGGTGGEHSNKPGALVHCERKNSKEVNKK